MQKVRIVREHKISNFPSTLVFLASNDVTFSDIKKMASQSMNSNWKLSAIEITPILPVEDIEEKIEYWASNKF